MKPVPNLAAVILAAGKGNRMSTDHPKVLHEFNGKAMIHWVVDLAQELGADPVVVVVGYQHERVEAALEGRGVAFALQHPQSGTAHAVEQTRRHLIDFQGDVLVLSGDVPGLSARTLKSLIKRHRDTRSKGTMLTADVDQPKGYGRVIKDDSGHLVRVVEEKDATEHERAICEINSGIYVFDAHALFATLPLIQNNNKQNEYYLPDSLYILKEQNQVVAVEKAEHFREIQGVNTKEELRRIHEDIPH